MSKFIVKKSPPLEGTIRVSGAKNSVLILMAATILAKGECYIEDVPDLVDVKVMIELLEELGVQCSFDVEKGTLTTRVVDESNVNVPYELTQKIRASITLLGPLLAKRKKANVSLPGGCGIGSRPIDLHLKGFRSLGVNVKVGHGEVEATVDEPMKGSHIYLDFPSVGATENIIMAAVLAEGTTVIENAAQEPEITDLTSFLSKMGAKISGAGTSTIRIRGVESLKGCTHQVMPDRIEAGTYMLATAVTKGKVKIDNVLTTHLRPVISKLTEAGVIVEEHDDWVLVDATKGYNQVDITTLPYPGFPTDMQAQFMVLLAVSEGNSVVKETIFENRFMHVNELTRMGASIKIDGSSAIVQGVKELEGGKVRATDLRAGAALIIAGLIAEGTTEILESEHIDRGFVSIEKKLQSVGANISRE